MGYDVRQLGKSWRAVWRDFLWGDESPVRERLDDVVMLTGGDQTRYFQAGKPASHTETSLEALQLDDELMLVKTLHLPAAASNELEQVIALEVAASSPFPEGDTLHGWRLLSRDDKHLDVALVMAQRSVVLPWLKTTYSHFETDQQEVWALVDDQPVALQGFGERLRDQRYRSRLNRLALLCVYALFALVLLSGLFALTQSVRLGKVEAIYENAKSQAREASQWRSELAQANEHIFAAQNIALNYPSPHAELSRLTALLNDDVALLQFNQRGNSIRIQGNGKNVAEVMQQLTEHPSYAEVKAPQAITKLGNTGLERFMLDLTVASDAVTSQSPQAQVQ